MKSESTVMLNHVANQNRRRDEDDQDYSTMDDPRSYMQQLSLLNRNISNPLPQELMYKSNKVIIKPRTTRPDGRWRSTIGPYTTYPTVAQSEFVRHL
jgi:hypothetical protein